jgi:arsenate reductase
MISMFAIPNCDTVKKARNFLEKNKIDYELSFITLIGPFRNHSKGTTRSSPNGTTKSSR